MKHATQVEDSLGLVRLLGLHCICCCILFLERPISSFWKGPIRTPAHIRFHCPWGWLMSIVLSGCGIDYEVQWRIWNLHPPTIDAWGHFVHGPLAASNINSDSLCWIPNLQRKKHLRSGRSNAHMATELAWCVGIITEIKCLIPLGKYAECSPHV